VPRVKILVFQSLVRWRGMGLLSGRKKMQY